MTCERWRIACHESGHCVASLALGGRCLGLVLVDGGGICHNDELLGNREAYAIASGPSAEYLAEEFAAPDVNPETKILTVDEVELLPVFKTATWIACQLARTSDTRKHIDSDSRRIAEWAIGGHESEPDTWAGRVAFAKQMAAEIVSRNADKIVRVASALFVAGSLSENEILELLKG